MDINSPENTLYKNIFIIIAIFYVTVLYVIFGIYVVTLLDEFGVNTFLSEDDEKESFFRQVLGLGVVVGLTACIAYIGRNLIQLIPFPLDGVYGFDYKDVREVNTGHILFVFLFGFSAIIFNKMEHLKDKLNLVKSVHFGKRPLDI